MFENTTHFDFDDEVILDTSFTPAVKSTQISQEPKRLVKELDKENSKTFKSIQDILHSGIIHSKVAIEDTPNHKSLYSEAFKSPNRVLKRKFPGPAGLLPEIGASNKSILQLLETDKLEDDVKDMALLSQQTNSVFEDGPWKEMKEDFHEYSEENLFEKFNIKWIRKQALKQLLSHKAPFLAAVIQNLEIIDGKVPTINITLKDATGEIRGTILYSLFETYSNYFRIGSVLVLKQFGVLSAGYSNHCLTITDNNLVSIYYVSTPRKAPNNNTEIHHRSSNSGPVKKVVIQDCNVREILKTFNESSLTYSMKQQKRPNFKNLCRSNSKGDATSFGFRRNFPVGNIAASAACRVGNLPSNVSSIGEKSLNCISTDTKEYLSPTKKKFNFNQGRFTDKTNNIDNIKHTDKKINQEIKNCDTIVISSSQISVKPDSKEHAEIWKNLLEGVDTDSLFDDF